jgi:fumarate hydratase subunit alpha
VRQIDVAQVTEAVEKACIRACHRLGEGMEQALCQAQSKEESVQGKWVLSQLVENARLAGEGPLPLCQDTGMVVIFAQVGQDVHFVGGNWEEALTSGVRQAYIKGYLRKSVVAHPLFRENTQDNTPPVIHTRIVEGEQVKLWIMPKGFGSENKSRLYLLNPTAGIGGVKSAVVETVSQAGGSPCPPTVVGVGAGGTMEQACLLAKWALARPVGKPAEDPKVAELEEEILGELNNLGIGPGGLGGSVTSFAVHMETYPTHIAGLPVAINLCCHAARHEQVVL